MQRLAHDILTPEDLNGRAVSVVETDNGRFLMEDRGWKGLNIY